MINRNYSVLKEIKIACRNKSKFRATAAIVHSVISAAEKLNLHT